MAACAFCGGGGVGNHVRLVAGGETTRLAACDPCTALLTQRTADAVLVADAATCILCDADAPTPATGGDDLCVPTCASCLADARNWGPPALARPDRPAGGERPSPTH